MMIHDGSCWLRMIWGLPLKWDSPNSWMVDVKENFNLKWMIWVYRHSWKPPMKFYVHVRFQKPGISNLDSPRWLYFDVLVLVLMVSVNVWCEIYLNILKYPWATPILYESNTRHSRIICSFWAIPVRAQTQAHNQSPQSDGCSFAIGFWPMPTQEEIFCVG